MFVMQPVVFNNALWIISLWLCYVFFEDTSSIFVLLMKIYHIWCKYHAFEGSISCQFCRCLWIIVGYTIKRICMENHSYTILIVQSRVILGYYVCYCQIWLNTLCTKPLNSQILVSVHLTYNIQGVKSQV